MTPLCSFLRAPIAPSALARGTRSAALTTTGPSRLDLSRSLTPHPPPSPSCCLSYVQPGSSGVDTHTTSPPHVTTHKPRLTATITSHCQHTTRTAQGAHGTTPTQHNTFIHSLIRPTRPSSAACWASGRSTPCRRSRRPRCDRRCSAQRAGPGRRPGSGCCRSACARRRRPPSPR